MEIRDLLRKPLPEISDEMAEAIRSGTITGTPFACKNEILTDPDLQKEVGYTKMQDGTYLVSMVCPMPNITPEMIAWWFWWHPQDSLRYQVWFPGAHKSIRYHKKDKAFFQQASLPPFQPNSQCPVEKIGGVQLPLRIDFLSPESFGFSREIMETNDIPLIVCGHVSALNGIVRHTEMAHIFRQTDQGLFLISRFWLGQTLKSPLIRKLIITDQMAKDMAEHCCVEYRNLCEILPVLYENYR